MSLVGRLVLARNRPVNESDVDYVAQGRQGRPQLIGHAGGLLEDVAQFLVNGIAFVGTKTYLVALGVPLDDACACEQ